MKTKFFTIYLVVGVLFLGMSSFRGVSNFKENTYSQEFLSIEAVYKGKKDNAYTFTGLNAEGKEELLSFKEIDENVLESLDLDSETLIETKFKVVYILAGGAKKITHLMEL